MGFNFVKFTDTATSFAARVAIRRTGQIGFNAGALNRFGISKKRFAVLYYDPANRAVGIELSDEEVDGAIEIKKSDSNTYVRAKNFCDRFGIDYRQSHRYELRKESDSELLYFELGKELQGDTDKELEVDEEASSAGSDEVRT